MDTFSDIIIETVRAHSCIYDKGHRDFKNVVIKEKAWAEVSEASGRSVEECKRKWVSLREKFTKEEKKLDLPTGSEMNVGESEWPYFDSMVFLKKFIRPRRTRTNTIDLSDSLEAESDTTSSLRASPVNKKNKNDKFYEACEAVQKAAEQLNAETTAKPNTRRKTNENFMSTICDLMEVLPEEEQDSAMLQMLTFVTDLRKYHIGK